MLFMVVERFKQGAKPVRERFEQEGRMLPDDVTYLASWIEADGARCFQLMEAPGLESLCPWLKQWDDLVDFEVTPVLTSQEFWSQVSLRESQ